MSVRCCYVGDGVRLFSEARAAVHTIIGREDLILAKRGGNRGFGGRAWHATIGRRRVTLKLLLVVLRVFYEYSQ